MRFHNIVLIGFLGIAAIGCSPYRNIYSNYDTSMDFTRYQTFAWTPDSSNAGDKEFANSPYDNDIVRNNAKNYITLSLTQRGLLVKVDSPDVVFQLVLLNEKKEQVVTYQAYPYYGYYYHNPFYFPYYYPHYRRYTWYGWGYPPFREGQVTTFSKTYVKGTITLNMFDRKLKKLVWTGSAEGDIYDPQYIRYDIHPAIDRIMREFPLKPGRKQKPNEVFKNGHRIVRLNNVEPDEVKSSGH